MPYYRFSENDILYNELKLNPKSEFLIYSGNVYYNQTPEISGTQVTNVTHVPIGHTTLYEYNVDRQQDQLIRPFIKKSTSLTSFKTITTDQFNFDFSYGDTISGSYPLSASISRKYYAENGYDFVLQNAKQYRTEVEALRNTLRKYTPLNRHYQISSSYRDYTKDELNIVFIPSIFYGSSIKKGSVDFKFFISGSLAARAQDIYKDGSLIQTFPSSSYYSGSNVGVVLYNEGFAFLYSPPVYQTTFDLQFDGNDYLAITNKINSPPIQPQNISATKKVKKTSMSIMLNPQGMTQAEAKAELAGALESIDARGRDVTAEELEQIVKDGAAYVQANDFLGNNSDIEMMTSEGIPEFLNYDPLHFSFSLSAWINLTSSQSGPIIAYSGLTEDGSAVRQYSLSVEGDKLVGHSGGTAIASTADVADGTWKLVTLVSNPAQMKIYINGVEAGSGVPGAKLAGGTTGDASLGGTKHLLIGAARSGPNSFAYYDGRINEVAIWNTFLNDEQVLELYNDGCPLDITKHSQYSLNLKHSSGFNVNVAQVQHWNFESSFTAVGVQSEQIIYFSSNLGTPAWNPMTATRPSQVDTTVTCLASGYKGFGEGHTENYAQLGSATTASWAHWGDTGVPSDRLINSAYSLEFEGVQTTPVMTMFAYAGKADLNHSNNMTSYRWPGIISGSNNLSSSVSFVEDHTIKYKNIVSGSYKGYNEPFSKQTFISSIGIYDKDKNLIATAKLATPLRKREVDEYIFKLKLDI